MEQILAECAFANVKIPLQLAAVLMVGTAFLLIFNRFCIFFATFFRLRRKKGCFNRST